MSVNCIKCGTQRRTGPDLLCDGCRHGLINDLAASRKRFESRDAGRGIPERTMSNLTVKPCSEGGIWGFEVVDERGLVIASVGEWHTKENAAENLAWANLFAAAPELFDLVRSLEWSGDSDDPDGGTYRACPVCGGGDVTDSDTPDEHVGHLPDCKLLLAIAKAEGRPQ